MMATRCINPNKENQTVKTKPTQVLSKSLATRRPVLTDVGNRVQSTIQPTLKQHLIKPRKPLGTSKQTENGTKTTTEIKKESIHEKKLTVKDQNDSESKVLQSIPESEEQHVVIPGTSSQIDSLPTQLLSAEAEEDASYSLRRLQIDDVDSQDVNDPHMVSEYIVDICIYLREHEKKYIIRPNFLSSSRSTPTMRAILVNWLVDVHINFKLRQETLYLCISIIDRYLQGRPEVNRHNLQLVGLGSLFVACKYEEMYPPEMEDLVYVCDEAFKRTDILHMEGSLLRQLNFDLSHPLSIHFLRRYSKVAKASGRHHVLARYLLDLGLLDYSLCSVLPSVQAAACCWLSLAILDGNPETVWTPSLEHYSTYSYKKIEGTVAEYVRILMNSESNVNQAVFKKYSSSTYGKISLDSRLKRMAIKKWFKSPGPK